MDQFLNPIYLITDLSGYTPQVSRLLSMMNYVRYTTMKAVEGLTKQQLDFLPDAQSNSIGALLLHFAAVEYLYQASTFEKRELTEVEMSLWGPALNLGDEGREHIKAHELEYYVERLDTVRSRTYEWFKTVDDEWLYQEEEFWNQQPANYYFMWFHVFEDEINHRGQIRLIRKRAGMDEA